MIGHYRVTRAIGRGGMGQVYLASDTRLGRNVALKLLLPEFTADEAALRRFKQEARAASALNHPNILIVHELGEVDGIHFIATEYVEGRTVKNKILTERTMKVPDALDVAIHVGIALEAAHGAGIIHRDIKPENIMLRSDGILKVLDFGIAKLVENSKILQDWDGITLPRPETAPDTTIGTPQLLKGFSSQVIAASGRLQLANQIVGIYIIQRRYNQAAIFCKKLLETLQNPALTQAERPQDQATVEVRSNARRLIRSSMAATPHLAKLANRLKDPLGLFRSTLGIAQFGK